MAFDPISFLMGKAAGGGGGGGSSWELIGTKEFEVSTTSTTATELGSIALDVDSLSGEEVIWVHIRDKAGVKTGYFYGTDNIILASPSSTATYIQRYVQYVASDNKKMVTTGTYGVHVSGANKTAKTVTISSKYYATYGTIDGTYKCDVYKLTPPFTMYE